MRTILPILSLPLLGLLTACAPTSVEEPDRRPATLLDSADITLGPDGRCFTSLIVAPPVFETVTEQVLVVPPQVDENGVTTSPGVFRNQEVERIAVPEQRVDFETLCPPAFTPAFISSLQRALDARNAYAGPITGVYDTQTGEAVRLFQNATGPNSQIIALETAQSLGLAAIPVEELERDAPTP